MEKSLLKQALNMGIDDGWIIRLLPGGEPPPWRALSRESSVPLEAWLTDKHRVDVTVVKKTPTHTHVCLSVLVCWITKQQ